MRKLALAVFLLIIPVGNAQEKQPPPNEPPHLWRASASEEDGKVVIRIARPEYVAPRKAVAAEPMRWDDLRPVTLGETVNAFGVDGKRVDSKAVLKAMAKPKGVAVFVQFSRQLLEPDPYYLAMLREGTIVLVVAGEDIFPLKP
ncbi:MAG TPA: hypothetical protein VG122_07580 [Gemmata sp.]|jgi:hypothetical protein|nr:hypothetical protein [Gemmata sp.]